MKKLVTYFTAIALVLGLLATPLATSTVSAQAADICEGVEAAGGEGCGTAEGNVQAPRLIQRVISTLLFVAGLIAVLFLIIGGIRYVTSNGDSGMITSARQTILYAIIGLVVTILAYAIVNFVVGALD